MVFVIIVNMIELERLFWFRDRKISERLSDEFYL